MCLMGMNLLQEATGGSSSSRCLSLPRVAAARGAIVGQCQDKLQIEQRKEVLDLGEKGLALSANACLS